MEKKTIAILGMMCAGCSARVEQKLNALDGISSASVNLPARTALVEYDPQQISALRPAGDGHLDGLATARHLEGC